MPEAKIRILLFQLCIPIYRTAVNLFYGIGDNYFYGVIFFNKPVGRIGPAYHFLGKGKQFGRSVFLIYAHFFM